MLSPFGVLPWSEVRHRARKGLKKPQRTQQSGEARMLLALEKGMEEGCLEKASISLGGTTWLVAHEYYDASPLPGKWLTLYDTLPV